MFCNIQLELVAGDHGVLHIHHIVDLHITAVFPYLAVDAPGIDVHSGGAVRRVIEEGIPRPLFEDHPAGDQTVPVYHHLIRHHHHDGAGALQAGDFRLQIGQAAHLTVEGVQSVGGEFHQVLVIHAAGLDGPDGYDHIFHH